MVFQLFSNICFMKIRSKHSNNTLLSLLRIFMKQMLSLGNIKTPWHFFSLTYILAPLCDGLEGRLINKRPNAQKKRHAILYALLIYIRSIICVYNAGQNVLWTKILFGFYWHVFSLKLNYCTNPFICQRNFLSEKVGNQKN